MRAGRLWWCFGGVLVVCWGCGGGSAPSAPSAPSGPSATAADRQYCVDRTNQYRAQVGRAPLGRSTALEAYADKAAEHDARVGQPHAYFQMTNGGGLARGENELPSWGLGGGFQVAIRGGLDFLWAEGPSGGHYQNIAASRFTEVGCGFYVRGLSVTIVQAFR